VSCCRSDSDKHRHFSAMVSDFFLKAAGTRTIQPRSAPFYLYFSTGYVLFDCMARSVQNKHN
jgi:hypothetical protein